MSSDGAHLGVSANRAIKTILGGEPAPTADEVMGADEFRNWILAARTVPEWEAYLDEPSTREYTDEDYGECARVAARAILEAFLADPTIASAPLEADYDWDGDPDRGAQGMKPEYTRHPGLSPLLRERDVRLPEGMSGFQWGWAANAARRCVELPPGENPAIVEIGT